MRVTPGWKAIVVQQAETTMACATAIPATAIRAAVKFRNLEEAQCSSLQS